MQGGEQRGGRLGVGEVADARQQHEAAARDGVVGDVGVGDGDDAVVLAPHDQRRPGGGEVEAVERRHRLATGVDDRADRAHERPTVRRSRQRAVGAPHLTEARVVHAVPIEEATDVAAGVGEPAREHDRHHPVGERQRADAEQPADLATEAAGADEHEAVAALGVLVGELDGDAATERVPDDGRARHVEGLEQVAHAAGVGAERVVAERLGRLAVTEQVGGDHVVTLGERRHHVLPGARASRQAVEQHDRRPAAGAAVADVVAVDRHVPGAEPLVHTLMMPHRSP